MSMKTTNCLTKIKQQTRLALPADDTYLYRLGVALYGFNSINSFMTEIICHIDRNQNRVNLLELESGEILKVFRQTLKHIKKERVFLSTYSFMNEAANLFEHLNKERSDFVHSYPITNKENEQILHRRKEDKGKYFEVNGCFLDNFICRLHDVSNLLCAVRNELDAEVQNSLKD